MRCREVEALWDDIREGMPPLRAAVHNHLHECRRCQDLYEEYEGVAYCLSCLPQPEPSCDLAKRVIEHHRGKIWADSIPGAGSVFSFRLPLAV